MKAQVSVDFMLSILAAMMFFILIIVYVNDRFQDVSDIATAQDAKKNAKKLALVINDVYLTGDGGYDNITLPETLYGGRNYGLRIYPNAVSVSYNFRGGHDASYRIVASSVKGAEGGLGLNPGLILINNTEGVIHIRNG